MNNCPRRARDRAYQRRRRLAGKAWDQQPANQARVRERKRRWWQKNVGRWGDDDPYFTWLWSLTPEEQAAYRRGEIEMPEEYRLPLLPALSSWYRNWK